MRADMDRSKLYLCVGENFRNNIPIGDCGDTKPLIDWMEYIFRKSRSDLMDFFEYDTNKDIVTYIYENAGKRLKAL